MCNSTGGSGTGAPTPPATWGLGPVGGAAYNLLNRNWGPSGGGNQPSFSSYFPQMFQQPQQPAGMSSFAAQIYHMFNPTGPTPPYGPVGGGVPSGGGNGPPNTGGGSGGGVFNDPRMPSFGGWAWGNVPVQNVINAGFNWFEVGYPDTVSNNDYTRMRDAGVTPFAYINLGELDPTLSGQGNYPGPILRDNGEWGTKLVDVTNQGWQDWLVRRAMDSYNRGARGIKWDVATPDIPPGRSRADVNAAIASVMQRIRDQAPDMRFLYNQGFDFAQAYPQYVNGIETEGLFSASSYPSAYLKPWDDPWYWGPQYQQAKALSAQGIPIISAEYQDPWSGGGRDLYNAIVGQGFIPYITSADWQTRGYGYNINPGW